MSSDTEAIGTPVLSAPGVSPRRAQTLERLLDAGRAVIAERGVQAASVEEICDRAGFTRGAFYSNFASKDELCAALLRQYMERQVAAADAAIRQVTDEIPGRSLDEAIAWGVAAFVKVQPNSAEETLVRMELQLHAIRTPEMRTLYAEAYERIEPLVAHLIEDAVARFGHRLAVPGPQAIALLHAVYNEAQIGQLTRGEQPHGGAMGAPLVSLLRALVVPV